MKKSVLIIEDDISQQGMLKQLVLATGRDVEVYTADNITEAYRLLVEKTMDVFLVDIILDTKKPTDTSGIKLVEKLRRIQKYMFTPVIFVTSLEDPTLYAYRSLNCFGYIEKPFDPARIAELLEKALNFTTEREKEISLSFRKDGVLYPVKVKDVIYMESFRHTMYIHLANKTVLEIPYVTCRKVLLDADTDCLVRCKRGTLINKEYVQGVDIPNRYLILKDGLGTVEIGTKYKKRILAEFLQ